MTERSSLPRQLTSVSCMLFDLDGTIIDSKADLARSVNMMLAALGRPRLGESTIVEFVGDGVGMLVRRALAATDSAAHPHDESLHATALALMRERYSDEMLVETRLYPGVEKTLAHFGARLKAIVTSKESGFAKRLLDHFGIASHFDCIVGGDTLSLRKPDPAPLIEAIRGLGNPPGKAVMIGDSENDVNAGRRAGTLTCAAAYGFRGRDRLNAVAPDSIIDSFDELMQLFS